MLNTRAISAQLIAKVLDQGISLSQSLNQQVWQLDKSAKGQIQDLVFGTLRRLPTFSYCLNQLTENNLPSELNEIRYLICIGMYQLTDERVAEHAAISETVEAAAQLEQEKLKGLVNGILRNFQRQQDELLAKAQQAGLQVSSNHPQWLISKLKQAYPKSFKKLLKANLKQAPMWLRVNTHISSVDNFTQQLTEQALEFKQDAKQPDCLQLSKPVAVDKLPNFAEGSCVVQDKAAQQAARLLDAQAGESILDACAAPGGKTAHILSHTPNLQKVTALDLDATRLTRVTENLERLKLQADVVQGDASKQDWWDGQLFDRILLDAPCSATGVIRRHPDILYLRRDTDIAALAQLQKDILANMWQMLKPGGTLLYATCSVMPEENKLQIIQFLQQTPDAKLVPIFDTESNTDPGWQIFPGNGDMDGFYYARLIKQANPE